MMADKQGLLGAQMEPSGAESPPAPGRDQREAYEEDWYRSLRALAERQQHLADQDEEPDEDEQGETPGTVATSVLGENDTPPLDSAEEAAEKPVETPDAAVEDAPAAQAPGWDAAETAIDVPSAPASIFETDSEPHLRIVPPVEDSVVADGAEELTGQEPPTEELVGTDVSAERLGETESVERSVDTDHTWEAEPSTEIQETEPALEGPPETWDLDPAAAVDAAVEAAEPAEVGAEAPDVPDAAAVVAGPEAPEPVRASLSSTDPNERSIALQELAAGELSDAETHRVEAMLLDPEADIRRLALDTLARRPDRVGQGAIWQALQDPTDEVRAAAVDLAARRGNVEAVAALLSARDWPQTQAAVLRALPEIVGETPIDDEALGRMLGAVGDLEAPITDEERSAVARLALGVGSRRILDALSWPDVPRLGAVRLLAHDRSPGSLRELAMHRGDPLEEIAEIAQRAADELAEAEAARTLVTSGATQDGAQDGAQDAPAGRPAAPPTASEEEADRITSLARALLDEDPTVRHLALSGLAGMDRGSIATWVRDAITTADPSQLPLAASTAQMLRLVEGAAEILDAASELSADARQAFVEVLASFLMPPEQLAGLLSQVREPHQGNAIRMAWQIGGPPLLPHLRPYLDAPASAVRQAVLDVFAESGDPSAIDVARVVLETDVAPAVRARAVRLLGSTSGPLPPGAIVRALSDPDPEVRATAIETLPDVEGAEVIDALTSSLSDQDDRVRLTAAKRLATRIEDHEPVWAALRRAPEAGRGDIIGSFERVREGSLTRFALERLRSPDQEERALAVEVCGWGTGPGCVEGAIHALLDPSAIVRRAATVALGRLRDPAAAKALGKALGDPDPEVRIGVVQALGVIDDEAVLGFLVSALNDPDPRVRDVTSQVLTEWSSPAVARRLAGVLAVPRLREAATDLLTRIGAPAVELLIDVLMQHNPAVVPTVGELLARIARPEELLSRLDAVEPERRLRGVEALGAIGGPEAADALVRSVADPDERIRARAAQLLPDLGDPRAEDALMGLLRDPIPAVVAAAQEALTRLSSG
jgi:HEAT repeat protein